MSYGQYSTGDRLQGDHFTRGDGDAHVPASKSRRKKTVYPSGDISHLWFHQTQDAARNAQGNLYYQGDTIYSYGSHFPIARHVANKAGDKAVLMTTRKWSNTTASHVCGVRRAIPSAVPVFHVDDPRKQIADHAKAKADRVQELTAKLEQIAKPARKYKALKKSLQALAGTAEPIESLAGKRLSMHHGSVSTYMDRTGQWTLTHIASGMAVDRRLSRVEAREMLERLDGLTAWRKIGADGKIPEGLKALLAGKVQAARGKASKLADVSRQPGTVAKTWDELREAIAEGNAFNNFFGIAKHFTLPESVFAFESQVVDYRAKVEARRAETRRLEQIKQAEIQAEYARKLPEKIAAWRAGEQASLGYGAPVMLRINGQEVETSLGARFPLEHAVKALPLILALRAGGQEYRRNGHTIHLGHYALDWIEANGTVHAGCHVVSAVEVDHFAQLVSELRSAGVCVKCGQPIRDKEFMRDADGDRHLNVCPLPRRNHA